MQHFPWTIKDILKATKGDLLLDKSDNLFSGISIDSRKISADEIFLALKGQKYDGHNFINDVLGNGIKGVIINKDSLNNSGLKLWENMNISCISVENTIKAFADLARFQRNRSSAKVIAITGSNGKTSTKEMISSVASRRFKTLSTSGNFNNEIGLPLTLFQLSPKHEIMVLELGMNAFGEIKRLSEICLPDIGVITNIGPAHLKGVGSIEGVMQAKGELLEGIKDGGTAVLNADDPRVFKLSLKTSHKTLLYGVSPDAQIRAIDIKEKKESISFNLLLPKAKVEIVLKTPGSFMVSNALAASAVGHLIGLSPEEIKEGIEDFKPVKGRLNICENKQGINIIDDTYNANPASMEAAIKTLCSLKGSSRAILVVGDMFELGDYSENLHKEIGKQAFRGCIAKIYATGEFSFAVASGAVEAGMNEKMICTGDKDKIIKDLQNWIKPGDWVLVKGSRAMGMEKIVYSLIN